jgi:hypothetical protein
MLFSQNSVVIVFMWDYLVSLKRVSHSYMCRTATDRHMLPMPLIGSRNKIETKGEDSSEVSVKAPTDDVTNSSTQQPESSKSKHRLSCTRCYRPTPRACICEALPGELITLEETEIVILQHPHELRQKNRSVPIFELCLENNNLHLCIGRRLGNETDPNILNLLQPPNIPILLYPEESNSDVQVLVLSQAKVQLQQRKEEMKLKQEPSGKIVVLGFGCDVEICPRNAPRKTKRQSYATSVAASRGLSRVLSSPTL